MKNKSMVTRLTLPENLKAELDSLVATQKVGKRWSPESTALLVHYYNNTEATIGTLCKIMEKVYPEKPWPYSLVNSMVQHMKKDGLLHRGGFEAEGEKQSEHQKRKVL